MKPSRARDRALALRPEQGAPVVPHTLARDAGRSLEVIPSSSEWRKCSVREPNLVARTQYENRSTAEKTAQCAKNCDGKRTPSRYRRRTTGSHPPFPRATSKTANPHSLAEAAAPLPGPGSQISRIYRGIDSDWRIMSIWSSNHALPVESRQNLAGKHFSRVRRQPDLSVSSSYFSPRASRSLHFSSRHRFQCNGRRKIALVRRFARACVNKAISVDCLNQAPEEANRWRSRPRLTNVICRCEARR
jgi:hypothetical protein